MSNLSFDVNTNPKRIISIDILRGIAVPGILIMNIQSFAMIGAAYINPTAYGDLNGINKWVSIISNVFANEKFMSLFSILFGAGVLLFISSIEEKGRNAASLHYRRMFWLFLFGMLHSYLIWYGDILVAYSLCGLLLFLFRNKRPRTLLIYSAIFFTVPVILNLLTGFTVDFWPKEVYQENLNVWLPPNDVVQNELQAMRGGWIEQMEHRFKSSFWMQTFLFLWWGFWRATSMMLMGMALFKMGVLSAERSNKFYLRMMLIGLTLGYAITSWGVYENFERGWEMSFSMFWGSIFNYVGSALIVLGYIGAIILLVKSARFFILKKALSNVGRMAFTNYILMSVICMFIFFGNGLGLYGKIDRTGQILIVFGIWIILFILSSLWLKKFKMGPLEWLWRVLTYWKNPIGDNEKKEIEIAQAN